MNRKQYEIDNLPTQIVIGHQTETGVTSIYFDCTSWLASWPDLVLGVWATQPGGTAAYPAATHMEGDVLVWDVTDSDTAVPGVGTVEIVGITTGKKKLSAIAKTQIMCTTTGTTTTPPEGAKAWVDNVMQAASDAETSKTQAATYAEDAEASAKKAEENAKSVTWETLAGKPSAFPPETHGHAMSEVDGLPDALSQLKDDKLDKTGTAADSSKLGGVASSDYALKTDTAPDSSKLGGKAPEYYLRPRNLLDNSDFTNPVNQRGQMSYNSVGYTIDRWTKESNAILTIADDCINIDNSANSAEEVVLQKVDSDTAAKLIGKTVTIAICTSDGTVYAKSGVVTYDVPVALIEHNGFTFQLQFFRTAASYQVARLIIWAGSNISVKWAALYEGSYTAETLPPYVPKGYAAELAECRLYYRTGTKRIARPFTSGNLVYLCEVSYEIPMRANPNVSIKNIKYWSSQSDAGISATKNIGDRFGFNSIVLSSSASDNIIQFDYESTAEM